VNLKPLREDSQCSLILEHLTHGRTLTPIQALEMFSCFRLAARIEQLRSRGHLIDCELIEENGKSFARYSIKYPIASYLKERALTRGVAA
jgi:hypothetical protein